MITIKNYIKPQSLEEAYSLNQKKGSCIIAGMLWTKMCKTAVTTAIDLSGLGLDKIEETDEQFSIGAMVSLRQLELHESLNSYSNGAVCKAVKSIVGVQFRNLATVGGSIWGRFGFSDVLTVFLAMDTYVELYNAGIIPLSEFADMKYDRDLLVRIIVKKTEGIFDYMTVRNQSTDFPVLACAIAKIDGSYRLSVGARPYKAKLLCDEFGLLSDGINDSSMESFSQWAAENVHTGSNTRGSKEYRTHLVRVLTQRLLRSIKEAEGGDKD